MQIRPCLLYTSKTSKRNEVTALDRTREFIRQAQEGNQEAKEILLQENTGLIWNIVKRFYGRGYDPEDLYQIGAIGLLKCIDNFDFTYDVKFSTYAVPMIMGEIRLSLIHISIVLVVIVTTLITPILLKLVMQVSDRKQAAQCET